MAGEVHGGINVKSVEILSAPGRHYWFLWRDFLAQYVQIAFQPATNP